MEALREIYPSGSPDGFWQTRLDKVNEYHREHGYPTVKRMTVYRAMQRMGWRTERRNLSSSTAAE